MRNVLIDPKLAVSEWHTKDQAPYFNYRQNDILHTVCPENADTKGDPTSARKVTFMMDDVTVNPCRDESLRVANGCY